MDLGISAAELRSGLIFYILLIVSLTLRAYAQAWMANRLGDSSPRMEGRLTLNPLPHLDLLGSVILPLICIFYLQPNLTSFAFFLAWTKPVPINPSAFDHPWKGYLKTQLCSPGMSVLLALSAAVISGLVFRVQPGFTELAAIIIFVNAMLIVIDLLPVPPLPGGMLLKQLTGMSEETFWSVSRWSGFALLIAFQIPPVRAMIALCVQIVATPFLYLMQLIARG